ncbi:hypothetical protein HMP0015_1456 [Acinetobacter haemolyticus ATCC 19194]|uniref:Uncharacterized protein n=1 Tax=Acinetobacter haemolyticus ATCC 19194 TaxID=707232 RepID=D4XP14_ACIHA|nr:hypothetical protein HMPREF0023_1382 [Acinetobacter sp. ATCC 27244]EFF83068.1 hypothetical protein HMP0015_1456 [Acinetobacter haemolyticus ATCC 19194]
MVDIAIYLVIKKTNYWVILFIKNAAQNAYELRSKYHPSGVQMILKNELHTSQA